MLPRAAAFSPSSSSPPPPPSLWRWRARARRHRYHHQRSSLALPPVDWRRQNVQLLFVDARGAARARVAAGLAERVADWCGLGRAVAPAAAGVAVAEGALSPATVAALAAQAARLGLRARPFTAPPDAFETADLDRYDLIVAIDDASLAAVRAVAAAAGDGDDGTTAAAFYAPRIASLAAFAPCRGPKPLARRGSDTLDPTLAALVASRPPGLPLSPGGGVPRADTAGSQVDWDAMVWHVAVGVAGLVQYLEDALAASEAGDDGRMEWR